MTGSPAPGYIPLPTIYLLTAGHVSRGWGPALGGASGAEGHPSLPSFRGLNIPAMRLAKNRTRMMSGCCAGPPPGGMLADGHTCTQNHPASCHGSPPVRRQQGACWWRGPGSLPGDQLPLRTRQNSSEAGGGAGAGLLSFQQGLLYFF